MLRNFQTKNFSCELLPQKFLRNETAVLLQICFQAKKSTEYSKHNFGISFTKVTLKQIIINFEAIDSWHD